MVIGCATRISTGGVCVSLVLRICAAAFTGDIPDSPCGSWPASKSFRTAILLLFYDPNVSPAETIEPASHMATPSRCVLATVATHTALAPARSSTRLHAEAVAPAPLRTQPRLAFRRLLPLQYGARHRPAMLPVTVAQ